MVSTPTLVSVLLGSLEADVKPTLMNVSQTHARMKGIALIKSMVSSVPAHQDTSVISVNQIQTSVLQTHA